MARAPLDLLDARTRAVARGPHRHAVRLGRLARIVGGMALASFAFDLVLHAHLGLGPWHVLTEGIALRSGWTLGTAAIVTNVLLFAGSLAVRERPGIGTLAAAGLGGVFIDLFAPVVPTPQALAARVAFLVLGLLVMSFGAALYMSARLGVSPLDGVMTGIYRRVPLSLAQVRIGLEVLGFLLGWWAGGEVGIGCVVIGLGIGPCMQAWLGLLRAMPQKLADLEQATSITGAEVAPFLLLEHVDTEPG